MVARGLSEKSISSVPRAIGPPALLEPDEKYAWDPSSLNSPIYNPTDGGHQTTSLDEQNTKRASRSPPLDVASQSRTSEHHVSTTFYPSYLPGPLRPLGHGLLTGESYLYSKQVIRTRHCFSNVPQLTFYGSANTGASRAGEGWEAVRNLPTLVASSPSGSNFGQKLTLPNSSLDDEWNRLVQLGPYAPS
jgi:hypothetical protein